MAFTHILHQKILVIVKCCLLALGLLSTHAHLADDTEIYVSQSFKNVNASIMLPEASDIGQARLDMAECIVTGTAYGSASPSYSIDVKHGIHHEEYVYIPVFNQTLAPRWNGNLKKFRLSTRLSNGKVVTSITDKYGKVAVNEVGVLKESAVDFWSNASASTPDGKEVDKGGVATLIDPVERLALTDIACSNAKCDLLVHEDNFITPDNAADAGPFSNAVLGLESTATEADRVTLINFIRGRAWDSAASDYVSAPHLGDMLHTKPVIVTYNKDHNTVAGDDGYFQQVIYASTNEGYLHAFDTHSGKELFAFMPSSLLKNINIQYDNTDWGNRAYGIDGVITTWVHDNNKDGVIRASDKDQVLLYFGMRRGGREYYALDVTDPRDPKLQWKIDGASTLGFSTLGQTWSTPYLARIRVGASTAPREVAIFTGGYDTNQDIENPLARAPTDTVGNDIFIVDAIDGELLWSAKKGGALGSRLSNANLLTHSIPGGVRILDMNEDGAIDRMYFADTAGQVFRLELPVGPTYGLTGARLVKFADLAGDEGAPRMFYNEPDVALLTHLGKRYLSVAIGTGYRAHPTNIDFFDRFYVLLDGAVNEPLKTELNDDEQSFTPLTEQKDLVKITAVGETVITNLDQGALEDETVFTQGKAGWYFVLPKRGEKVLATSVTAQGNVLFTTLVPEAEALRVVENRCVVPQTRGRYYSMNLLTGAAGSDLNRDGDVTDADVMTPVSDNQMPSSPQQVFNQPVCAGGKCTQTMDIRVGNKNASVEEHDISELENVFWTAPVK